MPILRNRLLAHFLISFHLKLVLGSSNEVADFQRTVVALKRRSQETYDVLRRRLSENVDDAATAKSDKSETSLASVTEKPVAGKPAATTPARGAPRQPAATTPAPKLDMHRRLKVVNGCSSETLWIAHLAQGDGGVDPQDIKIMPGKSYKFVTSSGFSGVAAARYWPKMGCDANGDNCAIGDSGGPGEGCVLRRAGQPDDYSRCAPPIDSKFEATFAAPMSPNMDTVDMSLVDGYTLPFKLEVTGNCSRQLKPFQAMDCSKLSLSNCPASEALNGKPVSLQARHPSNDKIAGCYSPCMKLTDDKWGSPVGSAMSPAAAPYCCAGTSANPVICKAGPVEQTQYVRAAHEACPEAYAYAFDDMRATIVCPQATEYTVTYFCPIDSAGLQV